MAAKDLFRECRKLGRSALTAESPDEIRTAIAAVQQAVRSRGVTGKKAKSLRGLRRTLEQKLSPVV